MSFPVAENVSNPMPQASKRPKVGVVVVNYQCLEDTLRCAASLESLRYENFFVVIVDGGSADDSGWVLQRHFKESEVSVVISPDNGGFAASSNIGVYSARVRGADYIWLLNPDTEVEPEALGALVDAAENNPQGAAFGSKILYGESQKQVSPEGRARIWGAGAEIDFSTQEMRMLGTHEEDVAQYDSPRECDYIPGCSMLIPAKMFDLVGFLPEEFFMYFEESDWCTKARRLGYKLCYEPRSLVFHYFDDGKLQGPFTVYYFNRNKRLFWFRYGTLWQRIKLVFGTLFRDLPQSIRAFYCARNADQRRVFKAHILSCTDFLFGRLGRRFR